jgi:hypothetical protein
MIDADDLSVQERLAQLDQSIEEPQAAPIRLDAEQIARLVPKRNVETWILCLNDFAVDEEADYKRSRNDWATLIRPGGVKLFTTGLRPNAQPPASCIPSLRLGVTELKRLSLRRS